MAATPEKFFQRATVVRLESEDAAFAEDLISVSRLMEGPSPRNPQSCFAYGRRCEYWAVCWEGGSLNGPEFRDQDPDR
jgi:hypothetical protein